MQRIGHPSVYATGRRTGVAYMVGLALVLTFVLGAASGFMRLGDDGSTAAATRGSVAQSGPFDASRFLLNALLAPALDDEALPLRWVDPRPALRCGAGASVQVDGTHLVPGLPLPDRPFVLEWHAVACRPFGLAGPRFDGSVALTVFREDWGFSALVASSDLRFTPTGRAPIVVGSGAASMPQWEEWDDPYGEQAAPFEPV